MEIRKAQTFRGSTYFVSLPRAWIDQVGIQAGTPLFLKPLSDGSLLVGTQTESAKPHRQWELTLDSGAPEEAVHTIIGAYLAGHETIRLRTTRGRMDSLMESVQKACDRVRGLVVVERGRDSVVLQDLLDPTEFNARKAVQHLHHEARTMLMEAVQAVTGEEGPSAREGLEARHDELDRIRFTLVKRHNRFMQDFFLCQKAGTTLEDSHNALQVAQLLERVGNHALRIAQSRNLGPPLRTHPQAVHVRAAGELAVKAVDDAVAAFQRRDAPLAHEAIRLCLKLDRLAAVAPLESVSSEGRGKALPSCRDCLAFARVFECLGQVGSQAKGIAETAIHQAMRRSEPLPLASDLEDTP